MIFKTSGVNGKSLLVEPSPAQQSLRHLYVLARFFDRFLQTSGRIEELDCNF